MQHKRRREKHKEVLEQLKIKKRRWWREKPCTDTNRTGETRTETNPQKEHYVFQKKRQSTFCGCVMKVGTTRICGKNGKAGREERKVGGGPRVMVLTSVGSWHVGISFSETIGS